MSLVLDYTGGVFAAKPTGGSLGTDPASLGDTLDLSTGNTFVHAPSANVTYAFSNPPASGTAIDFTLKVTGAGAYDIDNASYDSVSFSVNAQETTPQDVFFKPDGTKMYVVGNTGNDIIEYSLAAWDLSTASYTANFSVSSQDVSAKGVFFKPDGTKMYVCGASSGGKVYEYSLSSAWSVTSSSFVQAFSVASVQSIPADLFFKPDGTKLFTIGKNFDSVNEFALSTAWDISSASHAYTFSISSQEATPEALSFKPDGTKMYITGGTGDDINEYSLTAWDLSTASFNNVTFSVSSQATSPTGLFLKLNGSKMYVMDQSSSTIYQYSTVAATPSTITWPSSVKWAGSTAPTAPASGETDAFTFYSTDGGTSYYGFHAGDAYS